MQRVMFDNNNGLHVAPGYVIKACDYDDVVIKILVHFVPKGMNQSESI